MEKEAIAKEPRGRVTRTPVGTRNVLTVKGKDPNYVYRIVNDIDDRVQMFKDAGYELVSDDAVAVGDKRASSASSLGSAKRVSVGQGTQAVVMRISRDWYEEDQSKKQDGVDQIEQATKAKALNGTYGDIRFERK